MRTRPLAFLALLAAVAFPLARAVPASAQPSRPGQTAATTAVGPSPGPGSGGFVAPPTRRDEGLPVVLAAVLAAGVGSLHVRLLLNEPAARRAVADPGRRTVATDR